MRQRLMIAIIVVLVVVNAVLIYFLIEKLNDAPHESTDQVAGSAPTPRASQEPTVPPGGPYGIAVADDRSILRYRGGACGGKVGPDLTVSTDDGKTFTDVRLPSDVKAIFAVTARSAKAIDVIGAGDGCKLVRRQITTDGGSGWRAAKTVDAWFLNPRSGRVNSSRGTVRPGCNGGVVALGAVGAQRARAFCRSGVLLGTADAGQTWVRLGALDGVRAVTFPTTNLGYALAPNSGCQTRLFASEDRGQTWTPSGCLNAGPGRALDATRDRMAAIVADSVYVSDDDGQTWSKVP